MVEFRIIRYGSLYLLILCRLQIQFLFLIFRLSNWQFVNYGVKNLTLNCSVFGIRFKQLRDSVGLEIVIW
jgi:hypothetical protein